MECSQCQGIETKFGRKYVAKKLEKYRKSGPKKTTLALIKALQAEDIRGMDLIDIGGGVGDIQHAMLSAGANRSMNIEASTAFIEACQEEAARQGHAARITHYHGNFVDLAESLPAADIVTLDRVICCYHEMAQLVGLSAQKARRLYGVVYPRDTWWTKLGNEAYYNLRHWLQRNPMRNFIHPTKAVEALLRENGLRRCFYREMGSWQVAVFCR